MLMVARLGLILMENFTNVLVGGIVILWGGLVFLWKFTFSRQVSRIDSLEKWQHEANLSLGEFNLMKRQVDDIHGHLMHHRRITDIKEGPGDE